MTFRPTAGILAIAAGLMGAAPAAAQQGPAMAATHLPAEVIALACAPRVVYEAPMTPLRVTGGQDAVLRLGFAPGNLVTINAGAQNGISVGQEFYVRRVEPIEFGRVSRNNPAVVQTQGWVKVWAVEEMLSLVTVTHACDSVEVGDYLEPFALPTVPTPASRAPKAERDNYGRVLVGTDRRRVFGKGDFFVLDRGANEGITPGAQFVLYRNKRTPDEFLFALGEAVAVNVADDSATLQVTVSLAAIQAGDYVAIRKEPTEAPTR